MRRLVGVNIDVTEDYERTRALEKAKNRLEYDSLHDPLTGLGNRRYLDDACDALFEVIGPDEAYTRSF